MIHTLSGLEGQQNMFKYGYSIDVIKRWGRWRSNAVYKYLRE